MFQSCPTKLTEWLQRFAPSPPPGSEQNGDSIPHAFAGASVLVVCKHGAILGRSRHSGLWEDFGGARDESKNERPFDTAVRELTEESGLTAGDLDFGDREPVVIDHNGHLHVVSSRACENTPDSRTPGNLKLFLFLVLVCGAHRNGVASHHDATRAWRRCAVIGASCPCAPTKGPSG